MAGLRSQNGLGQNGFSCVKKTIYDSFLLGTPYPILQPSLCSKAAETKERPVVVMLVPQLCPTLCDLRDYIVHQIPLSMGFSRQPYWSGLPFPSPKLNGL